MSDSTSSSNNDDGFEKYRYAPSLAAAVIFIILFSASTIFHHYQMFRSRTWFLIPFCLGGICEVVGYLGRAISASEAYGNWTLGPYILQSVLLLVAPALFAASVYMELGRIVIWLKGEELLFIRRTWLTKIFVTGDVVSFLMQAAGAGLMAGSDPDQAKTGEHIIVGGLCVQVLFFGLFVVAAAIFNSRINHHPTPLASVVPWRRHMHSLYAVSILIFIRSIVRVVEFIQGFGGFIISHEVFLYIFDALMMFLAMFIMNWIHPSEVARGIKDQANEKERMRGVAQVEDAV